MKQLLKKVMLVVLSIMLMCPMTAMASPKGRRLLNASQGDESLLLPESVKKSEGRDLTTINGVQ